MDWTINTYPTYVILRIIMHDVYIHVQMHRSPVCGHVLGPWNRPSTALVVLSVARDSKDNPLVRTEVGTPASHARLKINASCWLNRYN